MKLKTYILSLFVFVSFVYMTEAAQAKYTGRLVKGTWRKSWDNQLKHLIHDVYRSDFVDHHESQIDQLCPGYKSSNAKREVFWHQLFVSLAWKESLHGPRNWVNFNGGKNIGLYQINPVLRGAYGCGKVDLYDAINNINCGVKMAKRLIDKYGSFLSGKKSGMAAYWQPLRATSSYNRKNRSRILSEVTNACKSGKVAYISTNSTLVWMFEDMLKGRTVNTIHDLPEEDLQKVLWDHPDALDGGNPGDEPIKVYQEGELNNNIKPDFRPHYIDEDEQVMIDEARGPIDI